MGALKSGRYFLKLAYENFRRVHGAPAIQIIVRETDHRRAVARGFTPKRVGGADLHWRVIDHAAVKRELAECSAKLLPGPHNMR